MKTLVKRAWATVMILVSRKLSYQKGDDNGVESQKKAEVVVGIARGP